MTRSTLGPHITVRPAAPEDRPWIEAMLTDHWGSTRVVRKGRVLDAAELPGFVPECDGSCMGLVTYRIEGDECEIVTLNSLGEGSGAGTCLVEAVREEAIRRGCSRLSVVMTNDNTRALRFYQRLGFRLRRVRVGAIDRYRARLKPEIPLLGADAIPIRDELELEMDLRADA